MEPTILKYLADDGVTWLPFTGDVPAPTASIVVKGTPLGAKDGSNQTFTTSQPYVAGTLQVYINGLAQSSFVTETNPLAGVFNISPAPAASDDLSVYFHIANTGVGNADTVDNFHASATSQPNTIPVLNSEGALDIAGDIYSNGTQVAVLGDIPPVIDYSTSEQDTGVKWVDGKAIYQKVINFGSLPSSGTKTVAHGITTIDTVVSIKGSAKNGTLAIPLPFGHPTGASAVALFRDGANVGVVVGSDRSSYSGYVTLLYTKV